MQNLAENCSLSESVWSRSSPDTSSDESKRKTCCSSPSLMFQMTVKEDDVNSNVSGSPLFCLFII